MGGVQMDADTPSLGPSGVTKEELGDTVVLVSGSPRRD